MSRKDRSGGRRHDPDTAEEVASIVEAAERAASALIDKADAEAKRYLAEAEAEADRAVADRLAGLLGAVDALVERAATVHRETESLLAQLRGVGSEALGAEAEGAERRAAAGPAERGPAPSRPNHLSAVPTGEPAATGLKSVSEPSVEPAASGRSQSAAGARLLATQLAVAGSSREEIEARLRSGFEIEDTASILDAILGPED